MPYVLFCLICVIWGSSFMLMKVSTRCLTSLEVGGLRALGGAVVLVACFFAGRHRLCIRKKDLIPILFVVVLGFTWPHSIQPWLVERIGGGLVGMSVGFTPLFTLIVVIPMLGHWPTLRQGLGVLGALVFLIILMKDGLNRSIQAVDLAMAISVPFSYSIANGLIQRELKHLPALELTMLCLIINSLVVLPLSFVVGRSTHVQTGSWVSSLTAVIVLGVIGTGMATFMFNKLIRDQGSLFATMAINITPLGAVLWGWAMGEQVTGIQIIALVGVLAMVLVVQFGAARTNKLSGKLERHQDLVFVVCNKQNSP